jgi:hypothetical protein
MRFARRSRRFLFAATAATALLGGGVAAAAPASGDSPAHPVHADSADPALVSVNVLPAQATNPNSYNGLAPTPPMGFNDWNAYGCNINEDVIKQTANAMAGNGMRCRLPVRQHRRLLAGRPVGRRQQRPQAARRPS